jgi:predicted TIM-barrel fold metal-dependent hydrolase
VTTLLFDAHIHFFGRSFFRALAAASPLGGDHDALVARVASGAQIDLPDADPLAHARRWLAELDHNDVQRAVIFASLPEEAADVARARALAPERFSALSVLNPAAEGSVERAATLLEQGFRGFLFFPSLHHYSIDEPRIAPVLERLNARHALALVHCGVLKIPLRDRFGLPRVYDMRYANPLAIIPAANAFPRVRFVIPHFGAGLFREALLAGSQCRNIYLDTSSSNAWRASLPSHPSLGEIFERAIDVLGPERILFGTDSSTFPRGWRSDLFEAQREALEDAGASPSAREAILGRNVERLIDET